MAFSIPLRSKDCFHFRPLTKPLKVALHHWRKHHQVFWGQYVADCVRNFPAGRSPNNRIAYERAVWVEGDFLYFSLHEARWANLPVGKKGPSAGSAFASYQTRAGFRAGAYRLWIYWNSVHLCHHEDSFGYGLEPGPLNALSY
jgi:hypothetical protein